MKCERIMKWNDDVSRNQPTPGLAPVNACVTQRSPGNMDSSFLDELKCPLTLEWLEDPVAAPCCGRMFSRASLRAHMDRSSVCPLCRSVFVCVNGCHSAFSLVLQLPAVTSVSVAASERTPRLGECA
jgi:hypothetical protein